MQVKTTKLRICGLCQRKVNFTTKHHLIPRSRHKNNLNKKIFTRQEVNTRLVDLCQPCHSSVHALIKLEKLEYEYNTIDKLLAHPDIIRYLKWIKNKPAGLRVHFKRRK